MVKQSPVTLQAFILPGKAEDLKQFLSSQLGNPAQQDSRFPYHEMESIHFARWFVIPGAMVRGKTFPPSVVYTANVDGLPARHLEELADKAAAALDDIFSHCEGYPAAEERTRNLRLQYLKDHSLKTPAFYIGAPGRTVGQIRDEAALHQAVSEFLNKEKMEASHSPAAALTAVRNWLAGDDRWSWAAKPFRVPRPKWVFLILFGLLLLLLLPFLLVLIVLIHFFDEKRFEPLGLDINQIDPQRISALKDQEDWIYQNQLTQVFETKPGLRRISLRFFLWATNQLARLLYVRGALLGTPTIHFARWFMIDEGNRFIFLSNFDGSYDEYLGDFVDNSGWGLNAIYGSSMSYPRTAYVFGKGAYLIGQFLAWGRYMQIPTQSWYSAYPNDGLPQIINRSVLRAGLFGRRQLSEKKVKALLRRI